MSVKTRIDIIVLQFERGLRCSGCSEENIKQISQLIKEQKIGAISIFLSEDRFKIYELIISIDWNIFKKCNLETSGNIDDIGGLQENGETVEVQTYLDELVRKAEEKHIRLSYCIFFSGALRTLQPEKYYRLKKELGFEESTYGWMNCIGRDMKESIPDLQEIKIHIRDIKGLDEQSKSYVKTIREWLWVGEAISETFVPSRTGKSGDYIVNIKGFSIEVQLTSQGEKKLVDFLSGLGISSFDGPEYKYAKQGIIISLVKLEEEQMFPSPQAKNLDCQTEKNTNSKPNKEASDSSTLNENSKNGNITAARPLGTNAVLAKTGRYNRIRRIKDSLIFNMLCNILLVVVLVFRNFLILNLPWNYITTGIGLVFLIGYAFNKYLLKDEQLDKLMNYLSNVWYTSWTCFWIFVVAYIFNKLPSIYISIYKIIFFVFPLSFFVIATHLCILFIKKYSKSEIRVAALKLGIIVIELLLLIVLILGLSYKSTFISLENAQKHNQANTENAFSNEKAIHYYNLDLPPRNDGTYDARFGPSCWASHSGDNRQLDEISNIFFNRIARDPIMATACFAYADREMGTKYTGRRYSEIANQWIDELNNIVDSFIKDDDLWSSEVNEFTNLLRHSSVSIEDVSGGKIASFLMSSGDEHPVLASGSFTWPKESTCHYLTYKIQIQGTEIKLSFLIESGFAPVLKNRE